ncbi:hypothetical protein WJX84_009279 [Apatococcus fuscideae]|uniref:DNA cross-link repair 1A protein n=1 Tax=Apatococcus fuscideae TaxID=2026836 RepID=A0AAW1T7U8_9CHLO
MSLWQQLLFGQSSKQRGPTRTTAPDVRKNQEADSLKSVGGRGCESSNHSNTQVSQTSVALKQPPAANKRTENSKLWNSLHQATCISRAADKPVAESQSLLCQAGLTTPKPLQPGASLSTSQPWLQEHTGCGTAPSQPSWLLSQQHEADSGAAMSSFPEPDGFMDSGLGDDILDTDWAWAAAPLPPTGLRAQPQPATGAEPAKGTTSCQALRPGSSSSASLLQQLPCDAYPAAPLPQENQTSLYRTPLAVLNGDGAPPQLQRPHGQGRVLPKSKARLPRGGEEDVGPGERDSHHVHHHNGRWQAGAACSRSESDVHSRLHSADAGRCQQPRGARSLIATCAASQQFTHQTADPLGMAMTEDGLDHNSSHDLPGKSSGGAPECGADRPSRPVGDALIKAARGHQDAGASAAGPPRRPLRSIGDVLGKRRREKTKVESAITFDSKKGRTARITDFMPAPSSNAAKQPSKHLPPAQAPAGAPVGATGRLPPWQAVPGTPFVVDKFGKGTANVHCQHWFLSHFHADHYGGLTRGFKQGLVHCTTITARLVHLRLKLALDRLVVYDLNAPAMVDGIRATQDAEGRCSRSLVCCPSEGRLTWCWTQLTVIRSTPFRSSSR